MWAWPRLLGWPRKINWLFSPVVGKDTYPGDLWGIDSSGTLLAVETKLDRGHSPQDPFADFVPYCSSTEAEELWRTERLRPRWERLLRDEERFLRSEAAHLTPKAQLTGLHRGVLPYSVHRDATWRWQELYQARIAPLFRGDRYRRAVERGFRIREARGNQPPVFVGLVATVGQRVPTLSLKGAAALRALQRRVEPGRVCLRVCQATRAGDLIRVECSTPASQGPEG